MSGYNAIMLITDWKNEKFIKEPVLSCVNWFSTDHDKKKVINDLSGLKYFDEDVDLDVNKLETKFANSKIVPLSSYGTKDYYEPDIHLRYQNCFVATPKILSTVMCTPFLINGNDLSWKIRAKWTDSCIKLIPCIRNQDSDYQVCDRLKRHLFFKKPIEQHRNFISFSTKRFYEEFLLNIGDHTVNYFSEICGVNNNYDVKTGDLNKAENFFIDAIEERLMNGNQFNPLWWSQAKLINAKQCIIGVYKSVNSQSSSESVNSQSYQHILQNILKFPTNIYADTCKYENLWSSAAAWNFLNNFLTFVEHELNAVDRKDRKHFIWEFERNLNNKANVTCKVIPISEYMSNLINFKY